MAMNVMTGNRALLKIKGETVGAGLVQSVSVQDDFGLQDVDGLGTAESVELVVGKITHSITISKFFVYNKKLQELGYVPGDGSYLTTGELDVEIIDNVTQATLEHYTGCKAVSTGRSYGKHAPTTEDLQLRALKKMV